MGESLYHLLGVDRDADEAAIRRAYRERVKDHHPDVSDEPGSAAEFKRVTTARDVLVDADERARYDRLGHDAYVAAELDADRWDADDGRSVETTAAGPTAGDSATDTTHWRARRTSRDSAADRSQSGGSDRGVTTTAGSSRSIHESRASATYGSRPPGVPTETASVLDQVCRCLKSMGPWLLVHAVFLVTAAAAAGVLIVRAGSIPVLSLPLGTGFFGLALFLSVLHVVTLLYV